MPRIEAPTVAEHRRLREASILQAAIGLLTSGTAVSMTSVAAAAGVPRSSAYEYFGDAAQIVGQARRQRDQEVVEAALAELAGTMGLIAASDAEAPLRDYASAAVTTAQHRIASGEPAAAERERLRQAVTALCIALREPGFQGAGEDGGST